MLRTNVRDQMNERKKERKKKRYENLIDVIGLAGPIVTDIGF